MLLSDGFDLNKRLKEQYTMRRDHATKIQLLDS